MTAEGIPSSQIPVSARAPGKCILFGEHAVVHGKPELLLAIDLHTQVGVTLGTAGAPRLNADPDALQTNPYLRTAFEDLGAGQPTMDVTSVSRIPRAAGLGSSAAFVAALGAALGALRGGISRAELARKAFEIERRAQGVGSPGDTSASVAGGYLAINGGPGEVLWQLSEGERRWEVRRLPDPGWNWVVAYSGIPRSTGEAVKAVGRRLEAPDGAELLEEFARVTTDGIRAVGREDRGLVGELMTRNQELLREVGVSHPRLEALIDAVRPLSDGTKLTGAGAGGSIVALPKPGREMEAARRISRAGGVPYVVRVALDGANLLGKP